MNRRGLLAWMVVLAWCSICGWYAFVRGARVPLLGLVDLGFHELGHLVMYLLPIHELLTAAMGSITQVAVPLGLAAYFARVQRDPIGAVACGGWGATSLQDASVYIADAPYERLELIGGEHDWAFVLGPDGIDRLHQAGTIASAVRGAGLVVLLAAAAVAVAGLARSVDALSTRAAGPGAATATTRGGPCPTASRTPSPGRDHRSTRS